MRFDNPSALWLLALAVPILLVYFYRGRVRPVPVPSLVFWEEVVVEEARTSGLRRLRHYISLLLSLLALVLLVSMLAGPAVPGWTHEPERVAFVLDSTLSMAAGDRLKEAREHVRRCLRSLYRSDLAALYDSCGSLVPFTTDHGRVLRALRQTPRWTRRPPDVVAEIRKAHPDARIVRLSDWGPLENAAVTHAALQSGRARIRLEGFGKSGPTTIRVEGDGERKPDVPSEVPGVAEIPLPHAELLRAGMTPPDAQPLDDAAFLVLPDQEPPRVVVLSEGEADPFLLRALEVLKEEGHVGSIGTAPVARYPELRDRLDESSIVIADGGRLEAPGPGVFACFGTVSPLWPSREFSGTVRVVDWDRSHPALDSVDPSAILVRKSRMFPGGTPLLRSGSGAPGVSGGGPGQAWVVFGFRLSDSDIRLSAFFYLFLRNLARWAQSGATRMFDRAVLSGEALVNRRPLVPSEGTAVIEWTDGRSATREEVSFREGTLRHVLVMPGFYRVRVGARTEWVSVPFVPPEEADLSNAGEAPEAPRPLEWYRDLPYVWVAGLALLLLLTAEWLLYQKRWI